MATVKENITNALSWFYERLKSNDLDPMQEQIDELNTNMFIIETYSLDNIELSSGDTYSTRIATLSKDGYTPFGILGYQIDAASNNGAGQSYYSVYRCEVNNNALFCSGLNTRSSAIYVKVNVHVLFKKD